MSTVTAAIRASAIVCWLAVIGCGGRHVVDEGPPQDDEGPSRPAMTFEWLAQILAACPRGAPATAYDIRANGDGWIVRVVDGPGAARSYEINDVSCNGRGHAVAPVDDGRRIAQAIGEAKICALRAPLHGVGTGGSRLDLLRGEIHVRGHELTIVFPEVTPHTEPSGAELRLAVPAGTCASVARE